MSRMIRVMYPIAVARWSEGTPPDVVALSELRDRDHEGRNCFRAAIQSLVYGTGVATWACGAAACTRLERLVTMIVPCSSAPFFFLGDFFFFFFFFVFFSISTSSNSDASADISSSYSIKTEPM